MEAGNVKDFVINLTIQDEMVRYGGKLYYFYGIRYDAEKALYYISIDRFGDSINDFEEEVFFCEAGGMSECLERLIDAPIWNGKRFYDVESEMRWVDG